MKEELYEELSNECDSVLRKKLDNGDIALITFRNMLELDYLSQDRYNRIIRKHEGLELI